MSQSPSSELTVSLWRGTEVGEYQNYQVPARQNQTILDLVTWVQRHIDPTLSYRFACRVGMCGSCAMTVNGRPCWTCRTRVSAITQDGQVKIGPLSNLPIIKDLTTDMHPFFEKWQKAKGVFESSLTRNDDVQPIKPNNALRISVDAAIECINCGVCYAACDVVRWDKDYLGPAALNRAWTLVNDVRDVTNKERLRAISENGGCHTCHTHQSCKEHCPVSLNPTRSIAGLKRKTTQAYLGGDT